MLQNVITVRKSEDLSLYGKHIQATLTIFTREYERPLRLYIKIIYTSDGPEFRGQEDLKFPNVPCSVNGLDWSFLMPEIVSEEQQEISIRMIQDQLIGDLFRFNATSRNVTLSRDFKDQIVLGEGCPIGKDVVLAFQVTSSIIGVSRPAFIVKFVEDKQEVWQGKAYKVEADDIDLAESQEESTDLQIQSVSSTGRVILRFSEPLETSQELSKLNEPFEGSNTNRLQIDIEPVEGQAKSLLAFNWTALYFYGKELAIQLTFERPYDISTHGEANVLSVVLNDINFFAKISDGLPLRKQIQATKDLTKQIDQTLAERIILVGDIISTTGKSSLIIMVLLRKFFKYSMNNLLGQVRSLGFITHYMIMQLNYAATVAIFFSSVFEFVTFDIVPTDEIYGEIFDFESDPYSEEADRIGYGSRLVIENTGSLLIYQLILGLQLLAAFTVLKKVPKRFLKLHKWANNKNKGFFWSGAIDFQDELFLCVALSLGINTSQIKIDSLSSAFNNLYALALATQTLIVPLILVYKLIKMIKPAEHSAGGDGDTNEVLEGGEKESNPQQINDQSLAIEEIQTERNMDDQLQPVDAVLLQKRNKLKKLHKNCAELKSIAAQEKQDKLVRAKFGGQVEDLAHRGRLPRHWLIFFVIWTYARRLFLVIIILTLYKFPSMQIVLTLSLTLLQTIIVLALRPYASIQDQRSNSVNEIVSLFTLNYILLFTGQFVEDKLQLQNIAEIIIAITLINFAINAIPILLVIFRLAKRRVQICQMKRKKVQMAEEKIAKLRLRTPQELEFHRNLTMRIGTLEQNKEAFRELEEMHHAGKLDDHQVAVRTQQRLNLEHQLDSDYTSPQGDLFEQVLARSSIQSNQLQLSSQRLIKKVNSDQKDQLQDMNSSATTRFGRKTDDLEDILFISGDEVSSANSLRVPESSKDVQGLSKSGLDDLASPEAPQASTFMIRTDSQNVQPEDEYQQFLVEAEAACDLPKFISEINQMLDEVIKRHDMQIEAKSADIRVPEAKQKELINLTINAWFDTITESCSIRLDIIEQLIESHFRAELKKDSEISQLLQKSRQQVSDIYFELIELQQDDQQVQDPLDRDLKLAEFAGMHGFCLPPTVSVAKRVEGLDEQT